MTYQRCVVELLGHVGVEIELERASWSESAFHVFAEQLWFDVPETADHVVVRVRLPVSATTVPWYPVVKVLRPDGTEAGRAQLDFATRKLYPQFEDREDVDDDHGAMEPTAQEAKPLTMTAVPGTWRIAPFPHILGVYRNSSWVQMENAGDRPYPAWFSLEYEIDGHTHAIDRISLTPK